MRVRMQIGSPPVPSRPAVTEERNIFQAETSKTLLPEDIQWLTNDNEPVYASPEAKKGGTLRLAIRSFPLTFRTVGPDSNAEFRGAILGNNNQPDRASSEYA